MYIWSLHRNFYHYIWIGHMFWLAMIIRYVMILGLGACCCFLNINNMTIWLLFGTKNIQKQVEQDPGTVPTLLRLARRDLSTSSWVAVASRAKLPCCPGIATRSSGSPCDSRRRRYSRRMGSIRMRKKYGQSLFIHHGYGFTIIHYHCMIIHTLWWFNSSPWCRWP